jgi:hypothetical protein
MLLSFSPAIHNLNMDAVLSGRLATPLCCSVFAADRRIAMERRTLFAILHGAIQHVSAGCNGNLWTALS